MSIAVFLKNNLKNIPPSIGKWINMIPYSRRPGIRKIYSKRKVNIKEVNNFTIIEKQNYVLRKTISLLEYAYENIKFYKEFYDKNEFHPSQVKYFQDIQKIPILTKAILNKYILEERSSPRAGRYIVNTGGSSGTPFGFYIEPSAMGHEWAHMHTIWEKLGYKYTDLKIVFGGRSDIKECVVYDVVRNHFAVDIYADYNEIAKKLKIILKKHSVKYLHGYPSSIYDFAIFCDEQDEELKEILGKQLIGAFLGSEYPHKHYRKKIEDVFGVKTISWYGHTERAVLAYEKEEQFNFFPFLTYGFGEAIKNKEGELELISTSYYNFASPLIRYNTEDIIEEPIVNNGILDSFKILKGREGEFVIDKTGKKINLTGLIFGRHHEIFNYSKFIQIKQIQDGIIEIHYVSDISEVEAANYFDTENLNFDIKFVKKIKATRTLSGKISLLIK